MNLAQLISVVAVWSLLLIPVLGVSNPVQLTPGVMANTSCSVTATAVAEGYNFSFSFRDWQHTNVIYSAYLKLFNDSELVAVCPIEKFHEGNLLDRKSVV